jgi:hypothetical protein
VFETAEDIKDLKKRYDALEMGFRRLDKDYRTLAHIVITQGEEMLEVRKSLNLPPTPARK